MPDKNSEPIFMETNSVLNLFDSIWFYGLSTFQIQAKTSISSMPEQSPYTQLTVNTKSKIDDPSPIVKPTSSVSMEISSPDSVLSKPHLETFLSQEEISLKKIPRPPQLKKPTATGELLIKKTRRTLSKSLSQLEFEELKGFMDLGFVFSEEDKRDLGLLEIVPGLQRLGRDSCSVREGKKEEKIGEFAAGPGQRARPYLSEAWEGMEIRKRMTAERPLTNWRVPAAAVNEIDMKDSLKWWAHTVASAVR